MRTYRVPNRRSGPQQRGRLSTTSRRRREPWVCAIESLNARFRRAVRHRGHFSNEQAALKVLYLVANQQRPNRADLVGRVNGWKQILNALSIHGERITATY